MSNDNPYSEAIFRTLKYRPAFPNNGFKCLEDVREWTNKFVNWYNFEHQHSGINFVTPNQRHTGAYLEILEQRKEVYEAARKRRPDRWSRSIRNWNPQESVALNPMKAKLENK